MQMDRTGFEKLDVYQLSEKVADTVWDIAMVWGHSARVTVGLQLIRSADSIGANLAEGYGRETDADRRRFVHMARGSLYETKHWLRRAYRRQLLTVEQTEGLKLLLDELAPRLNAYLNSIGRKKKPPPPPDPPTHYPQPTTHRALP